MSSISRWSYTNTATIRPFVGHDSWTGQTTYGDPYTIACTWTSVDLQERGVGGQSGAQGHERLLKHEVYTEDSRPKYLDLIQLTGHEDWETIRSRTEWDMSMFGDTPDFKLLTD